MPKRRAKLTHSAITQTAVDLYKLGVKMQGQGANLDNNEEFQEISLALHRALNLRPWHPFVFDVKIDDIPDPHLEPMMRKSLQRSIDIHRALALAVHHGA
jgi:hypothetical protein